MIHIILAAITYAAFTLQLSASRQLAVGSVEPNFLMAVFVVLLVTVRGWKTILWASAIGLLCDLLAADRPGLWMGVFTLVGFGFEQTAGQTRRRGGALLTILASLAVFAACGGCRVVESLASGGSFDSADLAAAGACTAYSAVIGLALLLFISVFSSSQPAAARRRAA